MDALRIGWAQTDITPSQPVLIAGQFHARLSEGVLDPVTATALVLDADDDQAVLVSCDLVCISDELRDAVRSRLAGRAKGLDPSKVVLNATHTHTAPVVRPSRGRDVHVFGGACVELPAMPVEEYLDFVAGRVADAVDQAWSSRQAGGICFGLGQAVIGQNRRWVDTDGKSTMYGDTNTPTFSHVEGYEDHSLNVLATWDEQGAPTGLVVNVPCTSQVSEHEFSISADFWHETRLELRRRLGPKLFVLPQCSAAGDQSPHLLFEKRPAQRMLELTGRTERQEIACRIADAVEDVLKALGDRRDESQPLRHHVETLALPMNALTDADVQTALQEADNWQAAYEEEARKLEADPKLRDRPRWYRDITMAFGRMQWYRGVAQRARRRPEDATAPAELHVIRLGEIALATNPFEYYLDFGIYIKARSPAMQTFVVQLAGAGTYVPTRRSVSGGGYGSVPASNPVGPAGGRQFAERTVEVLGQHWS